MYELPKNMEFIEEMSLDDIHNKDDVMPALYAKLCNVIFGLLHPEWDYEEWGSHHTSDEARAIANVIMDSTDMDTLIEAYGAPGRERWHSTVGVEHAKKIAAYKAQKNAELN